MGAPPSKAAVPWVFERFAPTVPLEKVAPEKVALDKSTSEKFTPVRSSPVKSALDKPIALDRFTPVVPLEKVVLEAKVASVRFALEKLAPDISILLKSNPERLVPTKDILERSSAESPVMFDKFDPTVPFEKTVVLSRVAPVKSAPERLTPVKFTPLKSIPNKVKPERLAPDPLVLERFTPFVPSEKTVLGENIVLLKSASERFTPAMFTPLKSTPLKFTPERLAPFPLPFDRFAPIVPLENIVVLSKVAPVRSVSDKIHPGKINSTKIDIIHWPI